MYFIFKFNSRFLKHVDSCHIGGEITVIFSDYMVKMENDVIILSKSIFYCRFTDDVYSRRKLEANVLFDWLDNYHPNIKLTIEVKASKFLVTKLANINAAYKFNIYWKNMKLPWPRACKTPKRYKQLQSMVVFIVQKEYHQNLKKKSLW